MKIKLLNLTGLIIAVSLTWTAGVSGQFNETAKWVPESANVLIMVDAKKILASKISKENRWKTDRIKAFNSGASFLPPSTSRLLIAANMDFEFMNPTWQVAVFEKSGPKINILNVSQKVGGNIETVGGKQAVILPNDSYLVEIDNNTLASMAPANRQATARWLRTRSMSETSLSSYLMQAIKFEEGNADIIVAFDLADVVTPALIKKRLEDTNLIKKDDLDAVCKTLGTIKGLTLGITINDKVTGAIKVDFNGAPTNLAGSAKEILLHAFKKHGLMIDDLESWTLRAGSNQLTLSGGLSESGLRQITSLIEHPLAEDFTPSDYDDGEVDMKTRTMQYFGAIQTVVEELRKKNFKAMSTYSKYFDKYARQIDGLSVLNVDPVVLSYGTYVADSLRSVSGGLDEQTHSRNQERQTYEVGTSSYHGRGNYSNYNGYTSRVGWGGGWGTNQRNRQRVSALAFEQGANDAKSIMREVQEATSKVRATMSEKYKTNF